MSNSTRSPSASVRKPWPWMAEWCTKQSFCPPSGVMKPKPLASLNHFTVPVVRAMIVLLMMLLCRRSTGTCRAHRPTVTRDRPHDGTVHRTTDLGRHDAALKKEPCEAPRSTLERIRAVLHASLDEANGEPSVWQWNILAVQSLFAGSRLGARRTER